MNGDLKRGSSSWASIASETLTPTEPPMCALCSGLHIVGLPIFTGYVLNRAKGEQNGLRAEHLEPASPYLRARPIAPKDGRRGWRRQRGIRQGLVKCGLIGYELTKCGSAGRDWPEDGTHPSRFDRGGSTFLTVLTQETAAAMTDTRGIQDA